MTDYVVVLVEPMIQGNIGAVARAMMNFGMKELRLVTATPVSEVARNRAVHAQSILDNAMIFSSFEDAVRDVELKVATTGIAPDNQKRHLRSHLELGEFAERIVEWEGRVALIFGRENYGLLNNELESCDLVVAIPTSEDYPILNLSHAVAVMLYHLFREERQRKGESRERRDAPREDRERLFQSIEGLLARVNYPEHKRMNTAVMIRRILGRAMISRWEFHTLMGIVSRLERVCGNPLVREDTDEETDESANRGKPLHGMEKDESANVMN